MIPHVRADEHATILSLHQLSVSTAFHAKLRTTLERGEAAVDRLLRSYDPSMADHHRVCGRRRRRYR